MTVDEILAAMRELVAAAEASGEGMSEEDEARYSELEGKLQRHNKATELRARQDAYETPIGAPALIRSEKHQTAQERAFDAYLRGDKGAEAELRAQSVGTDSAGGYTVPQAFRDKLVERMKAFGGFAAHVDSFTTGDGRPVEYPSNDDTSNSAVITAEGSQQGSAGADLVFGTVTLGAYKYTSTGASNEPLRISIELIQDSAFDIQAYAARKLGERIARKQAAELVTGTGSGMPKGILNGTADVELVTANDLSNAANGYAKLLSVVAALDPAYTANAKWLMNNTTWFQIMAILDGNDRPLNVGVNQSGFDPQNPTLWGFPVILDNSAPNPADDVNFLAFGDFREAYVKRDVLDVHVNVDPYTRGKFGQIEMTAWARMDGTVQNRNAYVILKGKDAA